MSRSGGEPVLLSREDYNLLSKFKTVSVRDKEFDAITMKRIRHLVDLGFLMLESTNRKVKWIGEKPVEFSRKWVALSPAGEDAILEFEQRCDEQAQKERQQRFDNKIAIASILVPLITFILGLVVEHFAGIMSLFLSLFQH